MHKIQRCKECKALKGRSHKHSCPTRGINVQYETVSASAGAYLYDPTWSSGHSSSSCDSSSDSGSSGGCD